MSQEGAKPAKASARGPPASKTAETFRPQVALIDLGMPEMNGFQVAERLRQDHKDRRAR